LDRRLLRAESFGATKTVRVGGGPDALQPTVEATTSGRGADIAIDMSGAPEAMESGLEQLRIGGRYVWVGAVYPARPLALAAETVVRKVLSIQGVHNYAPSDLGRALAFLDRCQGRFPFAGLVEETFALEDADAALAHASRSSALRVAVRP
jgi:alcohol dehydrogenase